MVILHRRIKS